MGCDIHMHAFQKIGASWFCVDGRYLDHYENELRYRRTYNQRNYQLFAALANVRNGWNIEPISEPRGLPDWTKNLSNREMFDFGDHSQTWLGLNEIIKWDGWKQEVMDEKLVDYHNFVLYEKHGGKGVKEWCKGSSGPNFTYDQREEFLKCKEKWRHIWVPCKSTLEEMWGIGEFLGMCKYELAFICKKWDDPSDVVLVFGFDS